MLMWFISKRRQVAGFKVLIDQPLTAGNSNPAIKLAYFLVSRFASIPLAVTIFFLELPVHLMVSPSKAFTLLARRSDSMEFLDSYTSHQKRARLSVVAVMAGAVLALVQFAILGSSFYQLGKPTLVGAYTSSVSLNPTWDRTGIQYDNVSGLCEVDPATFDCDSATATSLLVDYLGVGGCPAVSENYRLAMKFSLVSIPNTATITDVSLSVNVNNTTSTIVQYFPVSTDSPDTISCTASGSSLYETLSAGANFATASNWNTTGVKTIDLGTTADANVQSRLTGSDLIAIGIRHQQEADDVGAINSVDAASNKPQLTITYTLPPQTPTAFAHTANTTSTIAWTWTDNATVETQYDVHDAAHSPVMGCTNLAADSQSCTETGLTANTQYTRHPNVTDGNGNTDGTGTSAYTSIEAPSGITFGTVTATSIVVSGTGSFTNLSTASSGIYFQESATSTNSGWLTTNSWTKNSLIANTQYSFQAKTRNGDADETSLTSAATKYTLSLTPNVAGSRTTATWYSSGAFPFTNLAGWAGAGVQYYRYVWDTSATHTFTGSESTWGDVNANCPGGTCTDAGTTLSQTATSDSNSWYLHTQSFNGDDVANGTGTDYGPYYFDAGAPTAPATVNDGTGADISSQTSTASISANWTAAADSGSGLAKYQYAIGAASGGTDVRSYTDNGTAVSMTATGLTLTVGSTYYVSVRAVDTAANTGAVATSNGVIIVADAPAPTPTPVPTPSTVMTPTITNLGNGSIIADTKPILAGTGPATSTIFVVVDRQLVRTVLTDSTGKYHVTLLDALSLGDHQFVVRAKTAAGEVSDESQPITVTIVQTSVRATVQKTVLTDGSQPSLTYHVVAPGQSTIKFLLDGSLFKTIHAETVIGAYGFIEKLDIPSTLTPGQHQFSLFTVDRFNRPSYQVGIVKFNVPVLNAQPIIDYGSGKYVVQSGDSLWSIAQQLLGNGNRWTEIRAANLTGHPSLVTAPQTIYAGWTLTIPPT